MARESKCKHENNRLEIYNKRCKGARLKLKKLYPTIVDINEDRSIFLLMMGY